jgi:ATP/maltotriose-dependent transcriptional regulator MalT
MRLSGETHGREPSVLLASKLYVPALRDRLIGRAWLVQGLSAGNVRKLTLLSAPAGWGKTTLHAQWVDSEKEHVRFAWPSLDRTDNDPVRFWTYVVAALRQAQPAVAMRASDLLARGADLEESVLPTLLNELADLEAGSVLILDDYHLVTNPVVQQQMAFVIDRMPTTLHVVLATRSDPALLQRSADRDLARQLLAKTEPHATSRPAQREHQQAVGEPVTAKELEVLRLLATPMSRREIADRLYVSLNTVKTHQRGLYRKLGVADRTRAMKRGRQLGIL